MATRQYQSWEIIRFGVIGGVFGDGCIRAVVIRDGCIWAIVIWARRGSIASASAIISGIVVISRVVSPIRRR